MRKFYRQGDVVIRELGSIPSWKTFFTGLQWLFAEPANICLELTSETGHPHQLMVNAMEQDPYLMDEGQGQRSQALVLLSRDTPMTHEQHDTRVIPAGVWAVRRIRDYRGRMGD